MIRTSYRDTVFKTISLLLMIKVGQRFDDIRIESEQNLTAEQKIQLKKQYVKELLKESSVKKDIQLDLDDISKRKTEIVFEIMRQYSLDKNPSEMTYYHDQLCVVFDQCLWNVRVYVNKNRWDELGM